MPSNQSFTSWLGGVDAGAGADRQPMDPVWRTPKEQRMSGWGASPDTQYPDGYLGTQGGSTRRQDKLLGAVARTQTRSYERGVHKGERINPGDYLWPKEFNLMSGIENEVTGLRFPTGCVGNPTVHLVNGGKPGPTPGTIDIQRQSMLKHLLPQWR